MARSPDSPSVNMGSNPVWFTFRHTVYWCNRHLVTVGRGGFDFLYVGTYTLGEFLFPFVTFSAYICDHKIIYGRTD